VKTLVSFLQKNSELEGFAREGSSTDVRLPRADVCESRNLLLADIAAAGVHRRRSILNISNNILNNL